MPPRQTRGTNVRDRWTIHDGVLRHALAVETDRGLHLDEPERMLAAPVDVQGGIDARVRDCLLLPELSSDEGLAHYFGEGVFEFWTRRAGLAARRFDRVELSATAY